MDVKKEPIRNVPKKGPFSTIQRDNSSRKKGTKEQQKTDTSTQKTNKNTQDYLWSREEREKEQTTSHKITTKSKDSPWNVVILVAVIIVITLFTTYFARPALVGYSVYQDFQEHNVASIEEYDKTINELESELSNAQLNVSFLATQALQLRKELEQVQRQLEKGESLTQIDGQDDNNARMKIIEEQLARLEELLERSQNEQTQTQSSCQQQISDVKESEKVCLDSLQELEDEKRELANQYDSLTENIVESVCCKQKIDNPRINYYEIVNDRIFCLEEGEKEINCSFD